MSSTQSQTLSALFGRMLTLPTALFIGVVMMSSCRAQEQDEPFDARFSYEDGTYRGIFGDGPDIQVNVQFTLEGGVVTEASFRHLRRDKNYHKDTDIEPFASVVRQYQDALDHLVGRDLERHLRDLYAPAQIVVTEVDGYSGATIRSVKIISAIRDALGRGVYRY